MMVPTTSTRVETIPLLTRTFMLVDESRNWRYLKDTPGSVSDFYGNQVLKDGHSKLLADEQKCTNSVSR